MDRCLDYKTDVWNYVKTVELLDGASKAATDGAETLDRSNSSKNRVNTRSNQSTIVIKLLNSVASNERSRIFSLCLGTNKEEDLDGIIFRAYREMQKAQIGDYSTPNALHTIVEWILQHVPKLVTKTLNILVQDIKTLSDIVEERPFKDLVCTNSVRDLHYLRLILEEFICPLLANLIPSNQRNSFEAKKRAGCSTEIGLLEDKILPFIEGIGPAKCYAHWSHPRKIISSIVTAFDYITIVQQDKGNDRHPSKFSPVPEKFFQFLLDRISLKRTMASKLLSKPALGIHVSNSWEEQLMAKRFNLKNAGFQATLPNNTRHFDYNSMFADAIHPCFSSLESLRTSNGTFPFSTSVMEESATHRLFLPEYGSDESWDFFIQIFMRFLPPQCDKVKVFSFSAYNSITNPQFRNAYKTKYPPGNLAALKITHRVNQSRRGPVKFNPFEFDCNVMVISQDGHFSVVFLWGLKKLLVGKDKKYDNPATQDMLPIILTADSLPGLHNAAYDFIPHYLNSLSQMFHKDKDKPFNDLRRYSLPVAKQQDGYTCLYHSMQNTHFVISAFLKNNVYPKESDREDTFQSYWSRVLSSVNYTRTSLMIQEGASLLKRELLEFALLLRLRTEKKKKRAKDIGTEETKKKQAEDIGTEETKKKPAEDIGTEETKKKPAEDIGTEVTKKKPAEDIGTEDTEVGFTGDLTQEARESQINEAHSVFPETPDKEQKESNDNDSDGILSVTNAKKRNGKVGKGSKPKRIKKNDSSSDEDSSSSDDDSSSSDDDSSSEEPKKRNPNESKNEDSQSMDGSIGDMLCEGSQSIEGGGDDVLSGSMFGPDSLQIDQIVTKITTAVKTDVIADIAAVVKKEVSEMMAEHGKQMSEREAERDKQRAEREKQHLANLTHIFKQEISDILTGYGRCAGPKPHFQGTQAQPETQTYFQAPHRPQVHPIYSGLSYQPLYQGPPTQGQPFQHNYQGPPTQGQPFQHNYHNPPTQGQPDHSRPYEDQNQGAQGPSQGPLSSTDPIQSAARNIYHLDLPNNIELLFKKQPGLEKQKKLKTYEELPVGAFFLACPFCGPNHVNAIDVRGLPELDVIETKDGKKMVRDDVEQCIQLRNNNQYNHFRQMVRRCCMKKMGTTIPKDVKSFHLPRLFQDRRRNDYKQRAEEKNNEVDDS